MKPLISVLLLLVLRWSLAEVTFITSPSPEANETNVYIPLTEGQQNVTVSCIVQLNDVSVSTTWRDAVELDMINFAISDGSAVSSEYSFLSALPIGINQKLTIDTFTAELDRLMLACFNSDQSVVFSFGIPVITLAAASEVYNVTESRDFHLDLTDNSKTSFPPQVLSVWTIDGEEINNNSPDIITTAYNITIKNIGRTYTGSVVNLTVSNAAGDLERSEQFTLNVVYEPELEDGESRIFALLGDTINITAARRISGNPVPTASWKGPESNNIELEGRFSQPDEGTLKIETLQPNDFGNYTFTASNGIGNDKEITVALIQLMQPGQPRNLTHDPQTLTSTGVLLQWNPPHTVGVPSFLSYIITITSNGDEASKHTTNTSYFTLEDLHPGTSYNVSVSAVSDVFPEGGDKSETISFMTDTAGPVIGTITGFSRNGSIDVQWFLISTGGIAFESISVDVTCGTIPTNVNKEASYECKQSCINSNLNGSHLVGPVHAGFKYRCVVAVNNEVEVQSITSPTVDARTGIPSSPTVETMNGNILNLRSEFTGIDSGENFSFIVEVYEGNEIIHAMNYSTNGNELEITIPLSAGIYTVNAMGANRYGVSDKTMVDHVVEQSVAPSASPNTTSQTGLNLTIVAGAGGVGVAILLAVLVGIIVIVIYAVHRRTKYKSVTFTANGRLPEKKKQFDRPRIPSVGSTVLY